MNLSQKIDAYKKDAANRPSIQKIESDLDRPRRKDAPSGILASEFAETLRKLGFEDVELDIRDYTNCPYVDTLGKRGAKEPVHIFARPDGLLLTWDIFNDCLNSANLSSQWTPKKGLKEDWHLAVGQIASCAGQVISRPNQPEFMLVSGHIDSHYQLLSLLDYTEANGSFNSPFQDPSPRNSRSWFMSNLLLSADFRYLQNRAGLSVFKDIPADAERGLRERASSASIYMSDLLGETRFLKLPLWVQQMTGLKSEPV